MSLIKIPKKGWSWWLKLELVAGLVGLYIFFWGITGAIIRTPNDLDLYFLPAAKLALSGHPFSIYSQRYVILGRSYPNANGPLSLFPITVATSISAFFHWQDNFYLRRMVIMAFFAPFSILMAVEVVAAIERLKDKSLKALQKIFIYFLVLFSPPLWIGVLIYGHVELPILFWLILMVYRKLEENHLLQAGILSGLAILNRTETLLYLMPVFLLIVFRKSIKKLLYYVLTPLSVVALGLAPFLIFDRKNLIFSLVTYRGLLPANHSSFAFIFSQIKYLDSLAHFDTVAVMGFAALLCMPQIILCIKTKPINYDLYGLLAISALTFPFFIKTTVLPYYFLGPYLFVMIWWLGASKLIPWRFTKLGILLPVYFAALSIFTYYNLIKKHNPAFDNYETIIRVILVGGFILTFEGWLIRNTLSGKIK